MLLGCVRPDRSGDQDSKKSPSAEVRSTQAKPADAVPPAPVLPSSVPAAPAPSAAAPAAPPPPPGVIDELVEVTGEDVLARIRVSGKRGAIVNAWASWCGPCKEEFPMLVSVKQRLASRGIDVVFVSVDEPETQEAARLFAAEHGLSGQLLVAARPLGPFKRAMNPEWPGMLPATFLFDETTKLRYFWGGPVFEDELMPIVEVFLAGKAIDGQSTPGLSPGLDLRD